MIMQQGDEKFLRNLHIFIIITIPCRLCRL